MINQENNMIPEESEKLNGRTLGDDLDNVSETLAHVGQKLQHGVSPEPHHKIGILFRLGRIFAHAGERARNLEHVVRLRSRRFARYDQALEELEVLKLDVESLKRKVAALNGVSH